MKNRGKTSLFWGWVPVEGGGLKETVNESEYGACSQYLYMKIEE
jgi:hypothetical protein